MASERVERVRALFDDWGRGDFSGHGDLFDEHLVFILRREFPDAGVRVGIPALLKYMQEFLEPWKRLTIKAEEIWQSGDTVIARMHQRAVGETSGIETELRYFTMLTFRGPRIIRLESVREEQEVREALGLSGTGG